MGYRSSEQTLADLRILLGKLERERGAHDPRSFAELRRILLRRIGALSRELNHKVDGVHSRSNVKRAA